MKLTKLAQSLKDAIDAKEELTQAQEELACCNGTETFCYGLFDGGYIEPEQWIELEKLFPVMRIYCKNY